MFLERTLQRLGYDVKLDIQLRGFFIGGRHGVDWANSRNGLVVNSLGNNGRTFHWKKPSFGSVRNASNPQRQTSLNQQVGNGHECKLGCQSKVERSIVFTILFLACVHAFLRCVLESRTPLTNLRLLRKMNNILVACLTQP